MFKKTIKRFFFADNGMAVLKWRDKQVNERLCVSDIIIGKSFKLNKKRNSHLKLRYKVVKKLE